MSIELVMPSNHLIRCRPLLLLPSISASMRVFSNESALRIRWPKYWGFSYSISPSDEHPGLISFRMDWLDLLAVQGTLKSLLQHHSSKASILQHSPFFMVCLSHPYVTTGKTIALTRWTFVGRVMSLQMALFDSLLWLSNSPSCMFPTSSYYSSVDGHLGCFHLLVIINSPDMNVGVHVSFWIKASVPSRYKPSNGVAGSCVNSIFSF